MAPCIFVFTSNPVTPEQTKWINNLTNAGYAPFVDSVHKSDYGWLKNNFIYEHRFYLVTNHVEDFTTENMDTEMIFKPDLGIAFDIGVDVSFEEWSYILEFIETIVHEGMNPPNIEDILTKPITIKESIPETNIEKAPHYYELKTQFIDEQDTMLYQVTKPFTDLPYTTLTKEYSKKGHLPFFTSLFICSSWGVSSKDITFLEKAWVDLKMVGEFHIAILMKERTQLCYPSSGILPEPEPIVYRRSIPDVLKTLQRQRDGIQKTI